jgi:glycosyltransferase involved in cell wall biosynthesis
MLSTLFGTRGKKPASNTDFDHTEKVLSQMPIADGSEMDQISAVVRSLILEGDSELANFRTRMNQAGIPSEKIENLLSDSGLTGLLGSIVSAFTHKAQADEAVAATVSNRAAGAVLAQDEFYPWHELAMDLKTLNEPVLAIRSLERSVSLQPSFYSLWHLALLLMDQGRAPEALEAMVSSLRLNLGSDPVESTQQRQVFFRPLIAVSEGDWASCLQLDPEDAVRLADSQQSWVRDRFAQFLSGILTWLAIHNGANSSKKILAALIVIEKYQINTGIEFSELENVDLSQLKQLSLEEKREVLKVFSLNKSTRSFKFFTSIYRDDLAEIPKEHFGSLLRSALSSGDHALVVEIARGWNKANDAPEDDGEFSVLLSQLSDVIPSDSSSLYRVSQVLEEAQGASALPEVTVVVPSYNAGHFLAATLESIKAQHLENFECIVVDDGSTDGATGKIATSFARSDSRFRVVRHLANSGLSAARNSGIRAARAEKICFLDADDLLMPQSLENRSRQMDADWFPLLAGSYSGSVAIPEDMFTPPKVTPAQLKPVSFMSTAGECPFNANQPMFFTKIIRQMGGFDENLTQAEDYDMWSRVLRAGYVMTPVDEVDVTYRQRSNSMIRSNPMHHLATSMAIKDRANRRLDPGMIVPGSPEPHVRAWSETQRDISSVKRVFQFAGMALAQGRSVSEVAADIDIYLKDCSVNVGRNAISAGLSGYKRQITNAGPYTSWKEDQITGDLYMLFAELKARDFDEADPGFAPEHSEATRRIYPGMQNAEILFFPHKDYHVQTIQVMARALEEQGLSWDVVDFSCHYRDEGVRTKAKECGIELIGIANFMLGYFQPKAIVAFNDWDPIVRNIFAAARKAGVVTCSIVEGIQDYHDVDTGRPRGAYRSSEYVFLPGEFDKRYFEKTTQTVKVAGIPRVADLRKRQHTSLPTKKVALINSNFSYGVLTDARDEWVRTAVEGAIEAGFEPVITRHPADLGEEFPELVTDRNFYEAVEGASLVVNRFASGVLEALAMGRPVVYFNPHGEKIDKFLDPMDAYPIANDQRSYVAALNDAVDNIDKYKQHWNSFLDLHTGSESQDGMRVLVETLSTVVESTNPDKAVLRNELAKVDLASASLTDLKKLRELEPHYGFPT